MTTTTLLQPIEIVKNTGIQGDIPLCALHLIFQTEYTEFRKCLGVAFYEQLKADLTVNVYTNYKAGQTYNLGDKVSVQGIIYEALKTTTNSIAVKTDWKLVDKFQTACFNELWCMFLANYLAWRVLREHQPYLDNLVGEIKSEEAYNRQIIAIDNSANKTFQNMVSWVKMNNKGCFDKMKFIANTCCGGCGCEKEECSCDCLKSIGYHHTYSIN